MLTTPNGIPRKISPFDTAIISVRLPVHGFAQFVNRSLAQAF
jgi:hypothetical protein